MSRFRRFQSEGLVQQKEYRFVRPNFIKQSVSMGGAAFGATLFGVVYINS